MKLAQAKEWSNTCPFDFGWNDALITIYSIQQYEVSCQRGEKQYAPNIFYNQVFHVLSGIRNSASRKTVIKMLKADECFVTGCENPITGSNRDHLIPKRFGGKENLENTSNLCTSHNSSKGSKDLIEWWVWKEWNAMDLPRSILCLYTRLMWEAVDHIHDDLPDYIRLFITQRAASFPSDEHRVALYGSTAAAMSFLGWERMYGSL